MRISDWSSDVCSSDLQLHPRTLTIDTETVTSACRSGSRGLLRHLQSFKHGADAEAKGVSSVRSNEPEPTAAVDGDPVLRSVAAYDEHAAEYEAAHAPKMADRVERVARSLPVPSLIRSEEHTSELQLLMRIMSAFFCFIKKQ